MKKLFLFLTGLSLYFTGISQPCLPGGITFSSQTAIDNFQTYYPNCTQIEGPVEIHGNNITNLNGLNVLTNIGGYLLIHHMDSLTSLTGLNNVTSVAGYLEITFCNALSSLTGLDNLTSFGGDIYIINNPALTSLSGLDSLTTIVGELAINYNALTNLTGLEKLSSVGGRLNIADNYALTSLAGLGNVTSVGGPLAIEGNFPLTSLTGLNNLTSIGGYLSVWGNYSLTSLTGLENLGSIGGSIYIWNNPALTSLSGLDYIDAGSITNLSISGNNSLSFCAVQSICDYLVSPNGTVEINNNVTGCNSVAEVDSACIHLSVNELVNGNSLSLFPNPAFNLITVDSPVKGSLSFLNIYGQQLLQLEITEPRTQIDISALPGGIYFIHLTNDKTVEAGKFIKQ